MRKVDEKNRVDVEELPELDTVVSVSGSARQQEVGGLICLGIAAGVAIYVTH